MRDNANHDQNRNRECNHNIQMPIDGATYTKNVIVLQKGRESQTVHALVHHWTQFENGRITYTRTTTGWPSRGRNHHPPIRAQILAEIKRFLHLVLTRRAGRWRKFRRFHDLVWLSLSVMREVKSWGENQARLTSPQLIKILMSSLPYAHNAQSYNIVRYIFIHYSLFSIKALALPVQRRSAHP